MFAPAFVTAVKALPDSRQINLRDSRARYRANSPRPRAHHACRDRDLASGRRVLDRVIEQIREHLPQPRRIDIRGNGMAEFFVIAIFFSSATCSYKAMTSSIKRTDVDPPRSSLMSPASA